MTIKPEYIAIGIVSVLIILIFSFMMAKSMTDSQNDNKKSQKKNGNKKSKKNNYEDNINLLIDSKGNIFDEDGNYLGNYNYYYSDINYNENDNMSCMYVYYTSDNKVINPPTRRSTQTSSSINKSEFNELVRKIPERTTNSML